MFSPNPSECVSTFSAAELQQDYLARKELETVIEETETAFNKIHESIKTLVHVVSKQEKHLITKTKLDQ